MDLTYKGSLLTQWKVKGRGLREWDMCGLQDSHVQCHDLCYCYQNLLALLWHGRYFLKSVSLRFLHCMMRIMLSFPKWCCFNTWGAENETWYVESIWYHPNFLFPNPHSSGEPSSVWTPSTPAAPGFHFPSTKFSKRQCLFPSYYSKSSRIIFPKLWFDIGQSLWQGIENPALVVTCPPLGLALIPPSVGMKRVVSNRNWVLLTKRVGSRFGQRRTILFILKVIWTFIPALCLYLYV